MNKREDAQRRLRLRGRRDRYATIVVSLGGGGVLLLIAGLLFYLISVSAPLFAPASASAFAKIGDVEDTAPPLLLDIDEAGDNVIRFSRSGHVEVIALGERSVSTRFELPVTPSLVRAATRGDHVYGLLAGQTLRFLELDFTVSFDGGERSRALRRTLPFDGSVVDLSPWAQGPVQDLALWFEGTTLTIVFLDATGALTALRFDDVERGLPLADASLAGPKVALLEADLGSVAALHLGSTEWLHARRSDGVLRSWNLRYLDAPVALRTVTLAAPVSHSATLAGGASLLTAGDGEVEHWLPVRDAAGVTQLQPVRRFDLAAAPLLLLPEARRRGFSIITEDARLRVFHTTAERSVLDVAAAPEAARAAAQSARGDRVVIESRSGALWAATVDNRHPEASTSALLAPTWYEGYDAPRHSWQSSASSTDAEPKFGLAPLILGTLKAAAYGMVFALPIAVLGAIYTALFMAPALRRWVKPGVEVMAALPTVVLGFIAGLWLAPLVERNLAAVLLTLAALPVCALLAGVVVERLPMALRARLPDGWQMVLVTPLLACAVVLAIGLAPGIEQLFFAGDLRAWLSETQGIDYDQRNAIVVGIAMAVAVIPVVFAITEDAVHAVPRNLAHGALALGATRWQTFRLIVLPTASPGIFSALLIGFGRAVGETMIVLMASGNTPVLDAGPFSGMRTLAANLAVELPESAVASTHYRILFLTALVLFLFTFFANTIGEFVRQRLRTRYGTL